jgi:hypothetical protein
MLYARMHLYKEIRIQIQFLTFNILCVSKETEERVSVSSSKLICLFSDSLAETVGWL